MKKYCVISLVVSFLVVVNSAQAQYQSIFGVYQTVWKTSNCGALSAPCFIDSTYTTGNDTIINGMLFHELMSIPTGSSEFYIAEDTTSGSLWYLYPSLTSPWTAAKFVDMTLVVNDSFDFGSMVGKHRVDSVYVENNRKIIRFDESFTFYAPGTTLGVDTLKMIEGVGTNLGINPTWFYSIGNYLICQEKDSTNVFESNNHPVFDCYNGATSLQETSIANQISIQPNPAESFISVKAKGSKINEIEFIDVKGSVVKRVLKPLQEIEISELVNGVYFLKIYSNVGVVSKKLVIAR